MRILYLVLLFSLAIGSAAAQLSPNSTLEQLLVQSFHANINAERVVLNHIGVEAVEVSNGYLVTAVLEGYPAHAVDIRRGDIIEKADLPKEAMDEFMDRTYIENIWYFSKDKNKDIFRHIKRNTLESFFA